MFSKHPPIKDKCEWCELKEWRRKRNRRYIICYGLVAIMGLLYGLMLNDTIPNPILFTMTIPLP